MVTTFASFTYSDEMFRESGDINSEFNPWTGQYKLGEICKGQTLTELSEK